ncbi:MAG: polyprenyl diphosphate synthase [Victivallaceae bacterium]|nr:polyprenyl diphosphate synthase [Victivallaceae bacterium]
MAENKPVRHAAIIMDGNGRWAEKRLLPHLEGHRRGVEAVKKTIEASRELNIEYLTLYAFSTENWKRSQEEVDGLMNLLDEFIEANLDEFNRNNIKLAVSGRVSGLPESVGRKVARAVELTAGNTAGTLILALNYGGRAEIVDAAVKIGRKLLKNELQPEEITEELFARNLYVPGIPDPDIMIRTGGEFRLSNFLLWELSYSEIYVTEVLWPDFDKGEFIRAIEWFNRRKRRFGGR